MREPGLDEPSQTGPFIHPRVETGDDSRNDDAVDAAADPTYLVGIGASAGGLEALETFFESVPEDTGMAFVVIQHLSPDFKSLMDELLSRRTQLKIHRAEEGMRVRANSIYLIPPKKELTLVNKRLCLIDRDPYKTLAFPIDTFFHSLARDMGKNAIAVILSGTGSDGSRGIRDIHAAGGVVLVQNVETAKFDGMPRSAIETGLVDCSLPPDEMPEVLVRYINRPRGVKLSELLDSSIMAKTEIGVVFELLNREFGIDFSHYKPGTIARRVERRIELTRTGGLKEYGALLKSDPEELNQLYCDLLIGVTRFFRDEEAFAFLETKVLPELIDQVPSGEELRVWVAGCATGEEAYSLAFLIAEQLEYRGRPLMFKIFATDVHPASLDLAGQGIYDQASLAGVSSDRIDRFFVTKGARYQVIPEIRSRIVFSRQNVIKDAPFTRIDLITCRNLLIYLQPFAQRKAISLFHFGLRVGGVLVMGPSETAGEYAEEFEPIETHWKIFRKRRGIRLRPESPASFTPELQEGRIYPSTRQPSRTSLISLPLIGVYDTLLNQYMPPAILVDDSREVVHCFGGAGDFLSTNNGRFSLDVLDMLEVGLRVAVATALSRANKTGETVTYSAVPVELPEGRVPMTLTVRVLREKKYNVAYYLIQLERESPSRVIGLPESGGEPILINLPEASTLRLRDLESELQHTKENLQRTIEEIETSSEELQAANEELIASNEELQSTNEELHSVNEELYTVNAEHQKKIDELTEMTNDLDNLFVSFDIGLVFLDRELRIRKFTPRIADQFALLPFDVGRRIDSFSHSLIDVPLVEIIRDVLDTGRAYQGEVRDLRGGCFLLRVHPYLSNGQINGAVFSLIDIGALKQAQESLRMSERRYKTLTEAFSSIVWTADANGQFTSQPSRWESLTGQDADQSRGVGWLESLHPDDRQHFKETWRISLATATEFDSRARVWSQLHGEFRESELRGVPVLGPTGEVEEWVGQAVDIHDRAEDERDLRVILDTVQVAIVLKDVTGRLLHVNPYFAALFDQTPEALTGRWMSELVDFDLAAVHRDSCKTVVQTRAPLVTEEKWVLNGRSLTMIAARHPTLDIGGEVRKIVAVFTDITALRLAEQERHRYALHLEESNQLLLENMSLRETAAREAREAVHRRDEFLAMLSHELRNPLNAIVHAISLLERKGVSEDRINEAKSIVRLQSEQMGKLLCDLLDVSRVDHGTISLERQQIDITRSVDQAVAVFLPKVQAKGVELIVNIQQRPITVFADPVRLQQVEINLLNNAVRFTPEGGKIEFSVRAEGSQVILEIKDSGRGIPPEDRERIFDLFFRGSESRLDHSESSMGIGLTLVKRLVEAHNGSIRVESGGLDQGSTFTVTLPRLSEPQIAPPAPNQPEPTVGATPGVTVVVVEDKEDTLAMLTYILELDGFRVLGASDGEEGLALIRKVRPDIAFIDIGLPKMDGCELVRQLRTDPSFDNVILVSLTGYGQDTDKELMKSVGFSDHLLKPIRPTDVSSYISRKFAAR